MLKTFLIQEGGHNSENKTFFRHYIQGLQYRKSSKFASNRSNGFRDNRHYPFLAKFKIKPGIFSGIIFKVYRTQRIHNLLKITLPVMVFEIIDIYNFRQNSSIINNSYYSVSYRATTLKICHNTGYEHTDEQDISQRNCKFKTIEVTTDLLLGKMSK